MRTISTSRCLKNGIFHGLFQHSGINDRAWLIGCDSLAKKEKNGHSKYNIGGLNATLELLTSLFKFFKLKPKDVLFLTFYRADLDEAVELFAANGLHEIESNTVDAFQGREGKVAILHCVSATEQGPAYGFICDPRRLCVSLSRAAKWMFILGNVPLWQRRRQGRRLPAYAAKLCQKFEEFIDLMVEKGRYVNLPRKAIKDEFPDGHNGHST